MKGRIAYDLEGGLHGASGHAVAKGGIADGRLWAPEGEATLSSQNTGVHDCSGRTTLLRVVAPKLEEASAPCQGPAAPVINTDGNFCTVESSH